MGSPYGGVCHLVVGYVNRFILIPLNQHINIFRFNSKRIISGRITYVAALKPQYLNYKELIKLSITTLGYLIILR